MCILCECTNVFVSAITCNGCSSTYSGFIADLYFLILTGCNYEVLTMELFRTKLIVFGCQGNYKCNIPNVFSNCLMLKVFYFYTCASEPFKHSKRFCLNVFLSLS